MRLLTCALLLSFAFLSHAGTPLPDGPHIVTTGEGRTGIKPDAARITFQFEARAPQPLPAKQAVDAAVNRLLDGLDDFGIADADIRASSLSTQEDLDYDDNGKRISHGYEAERTVTILLRNVDRFNDLLDFGLSSGARGFAGIEFQSSQADRLRTEAKQKAVENARKQAAGMAQAFGASLGPVYSINSANSRLSDGWSANHLDRITVTGSHVRPARYIEPLVEFSESVNAVFELKRD